MPGDDADGYAAELRTAFASSLKRSRRTIGLSQRALGNLNGLSQRIICAAELGVHNMTIGTLARIARSVGGDVPKMLTRKDDEPEPGGSR
jgi:predicted transcriptional regulator